MSAINAAANLSGNGLGEKRNSITALQQHRDTLLVRYPSEDRTAASRGGIKKPAYEHLLNYT